MRNDQSDDLALFMAGAEQRLEAALRPAPGDGAASDLLAEAARHLTFAGGKRARCKLAWLFGRALGAPGEAIADVAAAAEMIHAASLLHDDVIDNGSTRRGKPTVNAQWGNLVAVLAGDWLLTRAFHQIEHLPPQVTHDAVRLVAAMTRASMLEVMARGRVQLSESEWRTIAQGKTGALFGWCGQALARSMGEEPKGESFVRCGLRLGAAFQMADDLIDLLGDAGKDRFSDILNRNPSWPVLAAARGSDVIRRSLDVLWASAKPNETRAAETGEQILASGAAAETRRALKQEIAAAIAELDGQGLSDLQQQLSVWADAMIAQLPRDNHAAWTSGIR